MPARSWKGIEYVRQGTPLMSIELGLLIVNTILLVIILLRR